MVVAVRLCGVRGTEPRGKSYKPLKTQQCCIAGGTGLSRHTDCFPREMVHLKVSNGFLLCGPQPCILLSPSSKCTVWAKLSWSLRVLHLILQG